MPSNTVIRKVNFQPGFNKNTTNYTAENYWVDGDKVRFRNSRPEKFGGWSKETIEQAEDTSVDVFTGTPRSIHSWTDLQGIKYLATGSEKKAEILLNSQIYDITPYRATNTLNNAITTVNTETEVTITHTTHGLSVGDYVYVDSQATPVDGITLSGEYVVTSVPDVNNFKVDSGIAATGSTSLAGGNLVINYLLEVGETNSGGLTGYGGSSYGTKSSDTTTSVSLTNAITTNGTSTIQIAHTAHGLSVGDEIVVVSQATPVDGIDLSSSSFTGDFEVVSVIDANNYTIKAINNVTLVEVTATGSTSLAGGVLELTYGSTGWDRPRQGIGGSNIRLWSFDNWGEDLIGCVSSGKVYQWDATNSVNTRFQVISNAPTENLLTIITQPSRHLCLLGTQDVSGGVFDPLLVRWASSESLTDWTPTITNTAGEYRLPLGNTIVAAIQTKSEVIILTDNTAYSMRYVGGNDVFQFEILATNISIASQNAGIDVNGIVYWLGVDNFYIYDGTVRVMKSSLDEYIFSEDSEGLLNFDQKAKTFCGTNKEFSEIIWFYPTENSDNNDRYVCYNYKDNLFYDGTFDRQVWVDKGIFPNPYGISSDGSFYAHEVGKDADGSAMTSYIKSGDIDLSDGDTLMFVDKFIPDFQLEPNRNVSLYLYLKKYPTDTEVEKGPYSFNNDTSKISLRARARHIAIKYLVDILGADFEIGSPRFSVKPDGRR